MNLIKHKNSLLLVLMVMSTISKLSSQINSPYTRFGFGDFNNANHTAQKSMGGISAAYYNKISNNIGQVVNLLQPAGLANIKLTGIDLGVDYRSLYLTQRSTGATFNSAYLIPSYLSISFPISKKNNLGGLIAFREVFSSDYSIVSTQNLDLDTVNNLYNGEGGLNQFILGVGKQFKNFNVGIQGGVNFGFKRSSVVKTLYGESYPNYKTSRAIEDLTYFGAFFKLGAQYEINLKKRADVQTKTETMHSLLIGATYDFNSKLNASQTVLNATSQLSNTGEYANIDTVFYNNQEGFINYPQSFSIGVTLNKTQSNTYGFFKIWSLGLEYDFGAWQNFKILNISQPTVQYNTLKLGGEFSPVPNFNKSKFNLLTYRFGLSAGNDYILIDGYNLFRTSVSFGMGIPIKKFRSYDNQFTIIHFNLEYGNRSNVALDLIENYFNINIGVSLNDIWFIKRKYD